MYLEDVSKHEKKTIDFHRRITRVRTVGRHRILSGRHNIQMFLLRFNSSSTRWRQSLARALSLESVLSLRVDTSRTTDVRSQHVRRVFDATTRNRFSAVSARRRVRPMRRHLGQPMSHVSPTHRHGLAHFHYLI